MDPIVLTAEMAVVLCLLGFTVFLFASEFVRVDLAAVFIMVLLGVISYLPGFDKVADVSHLFDGFASNAVIAIIAVMIIGAGLDKTGLMTKVAAWILSVGGTTEKRIVPIVSVSVGFISSFMQNVGAAALFLPVVSRIAARADLPMSRLLMPMGFCAILGGTVTLVGSSPLILLNDLIATANEGLPADAQMESFGLFSVTPIGVALVLSGILYFMLFGKWVLPHVTREEVGEGQGMSEYLQRLYGLNADIFEVRVPENNLLVGKTLGDVMEVHHLYIIGTYHKTLRVIAPVLSTEILAPCRLAVLGERKSVEEMAECFGLDIRPQLKAFREEFAATNAGVAEIVIPPDSAAIGKTAGDLNFRSSLGLNLLAIHRGDETLSHVETEEHEATRIGVVPMQAGDTLVVQVQWERLTKLKKNRNFVIVTSDFPQEEIRPQKVGYALLFLLISLGLILFTNMQLSLCLFIGAVGMILSKVLDMDEAYNAVGWNTVFLLASLLPLGHAVQSTGAAAWIAQQILTVLDGWPIWGVQTVIAVLAMAFSLVMSNVGATVLLVPLAVSIAVAIGGNPAVFALTVAVSTSNSFLIPTHQVNALIMGPGGYRVMDFVRTGGMMTVIFLVVSIVVMNLLY